MVPKRVDGLYAQDFFQADVINKFLINNFRGEILKYYKYYKVKFGQFYFLQTNQKIFEITN